MRSPLPMDGPSGLDYGRIILNGTTAPLAGPLLPERT